MSFSGTLKGLDLARYILQRLNKEENFDVDSIAKEFDNNKKFVISILHFLKEVEWISEDENGKYRLTSQGHQNCLDHLRF